MFKLDSRLENDTILVGNLPLCRVLLMNDVAYPWLILVPRQADVREIIDLNPADRQQLMQEISTTSEVMQSLYQPDKLNVANLGNVVEQLHIHVVARFKTDPAWPAPIWGKQPPTSYDEQAGAELATKIREKLNIS